MTLKVKVSVSRLKLDTSKLLLNTYMDESTDKEIYEISYKRREKECLPETLQVMFSCFFSAHTHLFHNVN